MRRDGMAEAIGISHERFRGMLSQGIIQAGSPDGESHPAPELMRDDVPMLTDRRRTRVLLIEDDPAVRDLYAEWLQKAGRVVVQAGTGADGLAAARRDSPDLIVLDIGLPDMDGVSLVEELKRDTRLRNIPVVVVSQFAKSEQSHLALAAAALSKPVNEEQFLAAIAAALPCPRRRILIIDDERDIRALLTMHLEADGFEVMEAENGADGLQAVTAFRPDVILLDIMMPGMDGFTVLQQIRAIAAFRDTPVIIQTGKNLTLDEERIVRSLGAGVLRKDSLFSGEMYRFFRRLPGPQ